MNARRLAAFTAGVLVGITLGGHTANAAPFTYNTYNSMVTDLEALAATYPELTELTTAQDAFNLPLDGFNDDLSQYILRITNEANGSDKAEVLIVGVQHGDEVVGLEVALETARLLLESY
ncbi:MAG: M14 family zinc carboxypeptidase, partial [Pseudomonadota bacterium]